MAVKRCDPQAIPIRHLNRGNDKLSIALNARRECERVPSSAIRKG